jgi:hypothetical protein
MSQPLLDDSFEKEEAVNENRPSLDSHHGHRKPFVVPESLRYAPAAF